MSTDLPPRSRRATPAATPADALARYRAKRDFAATPEPGADTDLEKADPTTGPALSFVVQKHAARRLHYDFRLEWAGVLKSWAVPKGPSLDPRQRRMAAPTEDHPLAYAAFEGTIPAGHYGAGEVIVWDHGTWEPIGDAAQGLVEGKLKFRLHGHKLHGAWMLVRSSGARDEDAGREPAWLLIKERDEAARPEDDYSVTAALPDSVLLLPALPPAPVPASTAPSTARKAALPETFSPQLATLVDAAPTQGRWAWEIKFDGYRLLARLERGRVRLLTRNGHDWTDRMPALARAVEALGLKSGWLDGEIVVLDAAGKPHFNALQNAFDAKRTAAIVYFLFDLPFADGLDLRPLPWTERRQRLKALLHGLADDAPVRFSADFEAEPAAVLQSACDLQLEGVIGKRLDAPYRSGRGDDWIKLKCQRRQEFVIAGFVDRADDAAAVGALLLGVHDEAGALQPVGKVGTGFNAATARELRQRLAPLERKTLPFARAPEAGRFSRGPRGALHWVEPVTVAEVNFAEWTPDGQIRHAVFVALREDKPAQGVARERAAAAAVGAPAITHPERVIDTSTGLTKRDLVRYYDTMAEFILPHLAGRPVSLVRAPDGLGGELFFQKHADALRMPGIRELDPALWPGHAALVTLDTPQALLGAAQMNVIEFHTWNADERRIDRPDRLVFDIDPGEGVPWARLQEAAWLLRGLLEELGLVPFLKTSGGKGLHVVTPIARRHDWPTAKGVSQAVVQHLARTLPDRFVAKSGPSNRVGRIFVDYLRNGHGATTAAAFSARARPGMGVSMPVHWDALDDLKGGAQWTVATAREHLSFQREDPWRTYGQVRPTLGAAIKRLGWSPTPR